MENTAYPSDEKLSLRREYLLERDRIENEIGDLEKIRTTLGINRRKLCRLLLVDPSAWTRWCRDGAPPHIYQALRWLIELRGLRPSVVEPDDLANRMNLIQSSMQTKIQKLEHQIAVLEQALTMAHTLTMPAPTIPSLKRPKRRRKVRAKKATRSNRPRPRLKRQTSRKKRSVKPAQRSSSQSRYQLKKSLKKKRHKSR